MTYTVSQLLNPITADAILANMLSALTDEGFQCTAWQEGSVQRTLLERFAAANAEQFALAKVICKGGFLQEASNEWLTLLAESLYGQTRRAATTAEYSVMLENTSSSIYTIAPNSLWFSTSDGKRYYNTTGGTLNSNGSITVTVRAESPGARYNTGVRSINFMLTPMVGVTCANLSATPSVAGNNQQSDASLRAACVNKWATLGQGSTDAAYHYWAKTASSNVTKSKVISAGVLGGLRLIISGDSCGVDASTIADVQEYIDARTQTGITVQVESAIVQEVPIFAEIYVYPGYESTMVVKASAAVDAYFDDLNIGETAYYSDILTAITTLEGVEHVEPTTFIPNDDVESNAGCSLLIKDGVNSYFSIIVDL